MVEKKTTTLPTLFSPLLPWLEKHKYKPIIPVILLTIVRKTTRIAQISYSVESWVVH